MKFFLIFVFAFYFHFNSVKGINLTCNYGTKSFTLVEGSLYGCTVSLIGPGTVVGVKGEIQGTLGLGKTLNDIEFFSVTRKTLSSIPPNLEDFFPNLKAIQLYNVKLEKISADDLKSFSNLEFLNLAWNLLTTLPADLFSSNPKLKVIYIYDNKLETVGQGILDGLNFLADIQLTRNVCIDSRGTTPEEIEKLKEELLVKCLLEGETIALKTTSTTAATTTPTTSTKTSSTTIIPPETTTESCNQKCPFNEEIEKLTSKFAKVEDSIDNLQLQIKDLIAKVEGQTEINRNRPAWECTAF